ncbi:TEA/ATTS domain family-domain-containing protein [Radiomyces spectabilis]|uniref:TEA/ATTS domain family-domain-containing protein n=1 Tax=Radiomyces spectabilis TaxID=64574 RepID=UPI002220BAAD|nr:TEA/ATTS domain family-domain-containing protein [Radiomyces spectabilis]KAI8379221.1 TEA/ATTS domain family-domain-containing protein [Radiomyces spectabilis]
MTTATDCGHKDKRPRHKKEPCMPAVHAKDKDEVWPPDVEAAFIEALETIPKLGRRKILVHGKPCGRNELISDYIFRKTAKTRTRKQVSSHIQVLKNTKKGDPHFMRLLTDSVDIDETYTSHQHPYQRGPMPANTHGRGKMNTLQSSESISSEESSMSSTSSPADYVFDMMYNDLCHSQPLPMLDLKDPFYDVLQPTVYGLPDHTLYNATDAVSTPCSTTTPSSFLPGATDDTLSYVTYSLWPNYLCFYLEYTLPYNRSVNLSSYFSLISYRSLTHSINFFWMKFDMNLTISDFFFNNASFFESRERRIIECTTTIYSFGKVVWQSKEVQQAMWVNEGKYMYTFVYENEFFDAFMKKIRKVKSWEEVDNAINNLCIVQIFDDIETKYHNTTPNASSDIFDPLLSLTTTEPVFPEDPVSVPLLMMIYEFERGQGTIDISTVANHVATTNDPTKTLAYLGVNVPAPVSSTLETDNDSKSIIVATPSEVE